MDKDKKKLLDIFINRGIAFLKEIEKYDKEIEYNEEMCVYDEELMEVSTGLKNIYNGFIIGEQFILDYCDVKGNFEKMVEKAYLDTKIEKYYLEYKTLQGIKFISKNIKNDEIIESSLLDEEDNLQKIFTEKEILEWRKQNKTIEFGIENEIIKEKRYTK